MSAQPLPVPPSSAAPDVVRCATLGDAGLRALLEPLGLRIAPVADGETIPGSYWGECEAGLIGDTLYLRGDTPVHSALHEASHWLCADEARRATLHTNAGGDDVEEHAVCYLECLLAARLPGYSQARCFADMDAWGYHFVLGSARAWFERDAEDAIAWLDARRPAGYSRP
ncbi:elongation factor P hydroxylase [Solimonas soli]|uniref:elongation factor P hydroxylase n=1 Tax=Solimonas soli TaxID=413479 RepID=UPI001FE1950A|nr:elongation factor P hydroxylase [Solimonas soli]